MQDKNEWDKIFKSISSISIKLENAGCTALVICSNTMHKIADQIQEKVSIPLINVIDETAKEINAKNIENIGLLGTRYTMEEDFYTRKLKEGYNLNPIIPDLNDRDYIHESIYSQLAQGVFLDKTKKRFLKIIEKLMKKGAKGIIFGCTEIPLLIKQEDIEIPVFDTLKIHLKSAVEFCLKE